MTATILLIRHAAHAHIGATLSGRQPGLLLTEAGRRQAARLAEHFACQDLAAIHASPILRAQETARVLAIRTRRNVETVPALEEIDFGEWTGSDFVRLDTDPRWVAWNTRRSHGQAPGGESMASAQQRIVAHIEVAAATFSGQIVAMVSHCDMIRAAIAHYLGLSLDFLLRFECDPASISRLAVAEGQGRLLALNETAA